MAYVPSTDKRPVYLDSLGQPMASGKLVYTDTATTPVAKTIYIDTVGTEGLNPQDLDASGRTDTEILLGTGAYQVTAYRFTGVDPIVEPFPGPTWVLDHSWLEEGPAPVAPVDPTGILNVPTMAALALVDPLLYQRVNVLGYYEEGDITPRFFEWDSSSALDGNLGTIVKYGTSTLGSWIHKVGNADVLDVRIFGALPGGIVARNGNISAAESWLSNGGGSPKTLYFPYGTYAVSGNALQYFNYPVQMDNGVYFRNIGASTTYTLQFNAAFEINSVDVFRSGLSVGAVDLVFNASGLVNPTVRDAWWQRTGITGFNSYELLNRITTNVPFDYTIVLENRYVLQYSMTADLTFKQHLVFEGQGRISNAQNGFNIVFEGTGSITNHTWITASGQPQTVRGILHSTLGNFNRFAFTNYGAVRSSWFASDTGDQKTTDLNQVVASATYSTAGTKFIFDHPQNIFGTANSPGVGVATNYTFEHESGLLMRTASTSSHVVMENCNFGGEYFIQGSGFVVGGQINNISNWVPPVPTTANINLAWLYALDSVLRLDGILDLGGNTIQLSATTTISAANMASATIRNGTIDLVSNYTILSVSTAIDSIRFQNVTVSSTANTPLVKVIAGGAVGNIVLDQVYFDSTGAACDVIATAGTGTIGVLDIGYCVTRSTRIVNALAGISNINIHDNGSIQGDLITDQCCVLASNNKITGGLGGEGKWQIACYDSTIVTGNRFYHCDLWILDNAGAIDAVVNGNQFDSDDTKYSRLVYYARTINTHFTGAIATGNSFIGNVTGDMLAILVGGPYGMGYEYTQDQGVMNYWSNRFAGSEGLPVLTHQICLTGNTSSAVNIVVPVTRGPVPGGYMVNGVSCLTYAYSPMTLTKSKKELAFYFHQNPGVFYLPASDTQNTMSSLVITPTYLTIDGIPWGTVPQYLSHDLEIHSNASNLDYLTAQFNCVFGPNPPASNISLETVRTWGMNICLYGGQPF